MAAYYTPRTEYVVRVTHDDGYHHYFSDTPSGFSPFREEAIRFGTTAEAAADVELAIDTGNIPLDAYQIAIQEF